MNNTTHIRPQWYGIQPSFEKYYDTYIIMPTEILQNTRVLNRHFLAAHQ